jgi:hypothetical protein
MTMGGLDRPTEHRENGNAVSLFFCAAGPRPGAGTPAGGFGGDGLASRLRTLTDTRKIIAGAPSPGIDR